MPAENKKKFLVLEGFAHGFMVLSSKVELSSSIREIDFWHSNDEGRMVWNAPEIGIEWPQLKGEYKGRANAEGYTLEGALH